MFNILLYKNFKKNLKNEINLTQSIDFKTKISNLKKSKLITNLFAIIKNSQQTIKITIWKILYKKKKADKTNLKNYYITKNFFSFSFSYFKIINIAFTGSIDWLEDQKS